MGWDDRIENGTLEKYNKEGFYHSFFSIPSETKGTRTH